ncbi:pentapeptide repeat-containing protein [Microbacterium rhizomatis]|uniref:Pentapeptide repeat-containing protein n=1 Tax=Microbacterium rhizomatis TaxID=1631477 RepID=A0A5J5J6D9_9MICO|nr:pentapeptide repeat-containing protein [Microbacterium rhizomatis]KAA9110428.1 pentapeptide repeat-containing protein [Microbacterium rhizomatis]
MARPVTPLPPRVAAPDLPPHLRPARLEPRGDVHAGSLDDLTGDVDARTAHIVESVIRRADVGSLTLSGATLTDVAIEDLRAVDASFRESRWQTVRVTGGRIGTLDLSRAELTGVELRGIRIDYLNLSGSTVSDVLFADCIIGALDAPQSTLRRAAFEGCRADEIDNRGWRIENLDLRGLEALHFLDMAALRGATMTQRQVENLARGFAIAAGVDVRD